MFDDIYVQGRWGGYRIDKQANEEKKIGPCFWTYWWDTIFKFDDSDACSTYFTSQIRIVLTLIYYITTDSFIIVNQIFKREDPWVGSIYHILAPIVLPNARRCGRWYKHELHTLFVGATRLGDQFPLPGCTMLCGPRSWFQNGQEQIVQTRMWFARSQGSNGSIVVLWIVRFRLKRQKSVFLVEDIV